jgi:hypothetical protein
MTQNNKNNSIVIQSYQTNSLETFVFIHFGVGELGFENWKISNGDKKGRPKKGQKTQSSHNKPKKGRELVHLMVGTFTLLSLAQTRVVFFESKSNIS